MFLRASFQKLLANSKEFLGTPWIYISFELLHLQIHLLTQWLGNWFPLSRPELSCGFTLESQGELRKVPEPTQACLLLSTSFHFNTRFTPTSQILLAMHNLNTFFFCIVHYTRCRFYRHESALFCLCVSTAVLECSGLFPYLLSTLPPPLHTHFFLKADILKHVLRGSFHLQYFSHRKGQ